MYAKCVAVKKPILLLALFFPLLLPAQDTVQVKVTYGDLRYMEATFKTKKGFQVYDLKKCSDNAGCPPAGRFVMYSDSAQKRRLYEGEFRSGMREGVWNYFDKKGNTVCEEEYSSGKLLRYTIFREGEEAYERTFGAPAL
jgi:hypothetical protein